jgi:hypothetical protein
MSLIQTWGGDLLHEVPREATEAAGEIEDPGNARPAAEAPRRDLAQLLHHLPALDQIGDHRPLPPAAIALERVEEHLVLRVDDAQEGAGIRHLVREVPVEELLLLARIARRNALSRP